MDIDEYLREVDDTVALHGRFLQAVFDPSGELPPFTYTVGEADHDRRELITLGDHQAEWLNQVCYLIENNLLEPGRAFPLGDSLVIALKPIPRTIPLDDDFMTFARRRNPGYEAYLVHFVGQNGLWIWEREDLAPQVRARYDFGDLEWRPEIPADAAEAIARIKERA